MKLEKVAKVLNLIKVEDFDWDFCHIEAGLTIGEYLGVENADYPHLHPSDGIVIYPNKDQGDEDTLRDFERSFDIAFSWYDSRVCEELGSKPCKVVVFWL